MSFCCTRQVEKASFAIKYTTYRYNNKEAPYEVASRILDYDASHGCMGRWGSSALVSRTIPHSFAASLERYRSRNKITNRIKSPHNRAVTPQFIYRQWRRFLRRYMHNQSVSCYKIWHSITIIGHLYQKEVFEDFRRHSNETRSKIWNKEDRRKICDKTWSN